MNELLCGAAAGCVATVPMTWTMDALHRQLPAQEQYPLPPRQITMRVASKAGVEEHLDEDERRGLTLAAHHGYGAAVGALYPALAGWLPLSAPLKGMAYGLAVWAGSYLGALPALGLLSSATRHPPRRTGLMIAAHLVWGAVLGVLAAPSKRRTE